MTPTQNAEMYEVPYSAREVELMLWKMINRGLVPIGFGMGCRSEDLIQIGFGCVKAPEAWKPKLSFIRADAKRVKQRAKERKRLIDAVREAEV